MDKLAEGDRIVLRKTVGLQFAVVNAIAGNKSRKRVRIPITYVAHKTVIDPVRSDPVTWYISCVPQWDELVDRQAFLNTKTGKIVGHLSTRFVGRYDPGATYEYINSCD